MKLYFPTSSLNFNDIFATESISPKNFYKKRSFGTRRHFKTEMSFSDNYITLFSEVPHFKLCEGSSSGVEEYSIIFELDLDNVQYELTEISNGVYITSKTIYLNKYNTKVLFLSHDNMDTILVKEKTVSETKMVQKYIDRFEVKKSLEKQTPIIPMEKLYPIIPQDIALIEMENDRFFNNFKGLYYAYISKRYEEEHVKDLPKYSFNCNEVGTGITEIKFDEAVNLLNIFQLNYKNEVQFDNTVWNQNDELKVYQIVVNCILCNPKSKVGDISKEEILELVHKNGQKITEEFGTNSSYREDCRLIYKKIKERIFEIDTSHIKSNVLQNFLVFILKYNNIYEMDTYLQSKNIKNSFITYSFLGAFLGFSGLSRTITHELLTSNNEELFKVIDSSLNKFRNDIWNNNKKNERRNK